MDDTMKSIKRRKIEKALADDEDGILLKKEKANPHIPNDILFDIITRLPPKSLHRFKSVSKEWCSLIQDQTFEDFYFDYRCRQTNTIRLFGRCARHYNFYFIDHVGKASKIEGSFDAATLSDHLVPACNGLFCFHQSGNNLIVWNPVTKQIINLPKPDFLQHEGTPIPRLGFGFDIISRKLKVVECCGYGAPIQVLTLGDKEWRTVKGSTDMRILPNCELDKVIHINGVLYWVNTRRRPIDPSMKPMRRGPLTITSFNLADEEFGVVPVPDGFINFDHWLCELEGHLCLIGHEGNILDIWVLITFNEEEQQQWVNERIVLPFEMVFMDSILPIRDGEILIQCVTEKCFYLCRYDQEDKVWETSKVNGLPTYFSVAGNYVESLVNLSNYNVNA